MGIYNILLRTRNGISNEEWTHVYKETLIALKNFPFADKVLGKRIGVKDYYQVSQSQERYLTANKKDLGWHVFGDLETCHYAESFQLIADNNYYTTSAAPSEDKHDILEYVLAEDDQAITTVWHNKTQGEPFHIPLLAIACLLEDRLSGKVIVQGDIRLIEVEEAVNWINQYVETPVAYPVSFNPHNLIERLKLIYVNTEDQLHNFFQLYKDTLDSTIKPILVESIGVDAVDEFYKKMLGAYAVDSADCVKVANQMMQIGYNLEGMANLFLTSKHRTNDDLETFIQYILDRTINLYFLPKNEVYTPGNVEGQLFTMFEMMAGYKRNQYKLSTEENQQLIDTLKHLFPELQSKIDSWSAKAIAKRNTTEALFEEYTSVLESKMEECTEAINTYDITCLDELAGWVPSETIIPEIEQQLSSVVSFIQKFNIEENSCELQDLVNQLVSNEKVEYLLREESMRFLLPDRFWDYITLNLTNHKIVFILMVILKIDVSSNNTYQLVKGILCNPALFDKYVVEKIVF